MSLHKTNICIVKSLVNIAGVSWHSLRRFIKPAPGITKYKSTMLISSGSDDLDGIGAHLYFVIVLKTKIK